MRHARPLSALAPPILALLLFTPSPASATNCAVCDATNTCTNGGTCLSGIPETGGSSGRCGDPCPNPGSPFGGCPQHYVCMPLNNGGDACVPRSDDCTNLTNYTERNFGESCTTQSCASGLLCIGFCTMECTGWPNQGSCPSGMACSKFGSPSAPLYLCANPVNEGDRCVDGSGCPVGYCLTTNGTDTYCYKDCASNPNACNASQTCQTYNLNGGGMISVCEPPGAAGPSDAGFPPPHDAGFGFPDAWSPTDSGFVFPDAWSPPDSGFIFPDASNDPWDSGLGRDAGPIGPGTDAGVIDTDASSIGGDGAVARDTGSGGGGGGRTRGGAAPSSRSSGCACVAAPSDPQRGAILIALLLAPFVATLLSTPRRRARRKRR